METRESVSDGELVRRAGNGDAEAFGALAARYETPLFSYAARMLGGLGDGKRCVVAALAYGWRDLQGGAAPSRPQPPAWLYGLVREQAFNQLARRAPADTGEGDVGATGDCVEQAADAALRTQRPAHREVLILRDVHGLDAPLLCAVLDMSEADAENLLYRARAEFGKTFAAQPAPERCSARRSSCPDCAERERLRAVPQHALLRLGPLGVPDRLRPDLRSTLRGARAPG
jgi:RNA polymerase sigma-70 factor (ECF subfamily)